MPDDQNNRNMIQAAGAIIWRVSSGGKEIVIVRQPRRDGSAEKTRWALPQKLLSQSPSRLEDVALDAGRVATNCHSLLLGDLAGSTSHIDSNGLNVVLFWNMTSADQWALPRTGDQYAWLSVRKAAEKLACASERDLVIRNHGSVDQGSWLPNWIQRLPKSASHRRLASAIPAYHAELEHLQIESQTDDAKVAIALEHALEQLDDAQAALRTGEVEIGWRCFNTAQRTALYAMRQLRPGAFHAKARTLSQEAAKKLKPDSWRRKAIDNLLSKDGKFNADVDADTVSYACLLLQEHSDNTYHKLWVVGRQLSILAAVGLIAAILWVIIAPQPYLKLPPSNELSFLVTVVLTGAMGACISGIGSLAKNSNDIGIPDQLSTSWITLARPVVGAIAALAVYIFLVSSVFTVGGVVVTQGVILAASFAAGFSERLITQLVESVAK